MKKTLCQRIFADWLVTCMQRCTYWSPPSWHGCRSHGAGRGPTQHWGRLSPATSISSSRCYIVALQCIVTFLHCYNVTLSQCLIVTLLHCNIVALLHCCIVTLKHWSIETLLQCCIVLLHWKLHHFLLSLWHCDTPLSLKQLLMLMLVNVMALTSRRMMRVNILAGKQPVLAGSSSANVVSN